MKKEAVKNKCSSVWDGKARALSEPGGKGSPPPTARTRLGSAQPLKAIPSLPLVVLPPVFPVMLFVPTRLQHIIFSIE